MHNTYLSIVIPAYNEESRISETIDHVRDYLNKNFMKFEIIVIDDGSSDGTSSIVNEQCARLTEIKLLRSMKNLGKGYSVKKGVLASEGNIILICDADLSAPIEEIEKLIPYLDNGFDIVIGSRGLRDSEIVIHQPWCREKMGRIFNVFVRALIFDGIKDTQCGFKLFTAESAREIFNKSRMNGFSYDVEILFISMIRGLKIKEVPIRWAHSPDSKIRPLEDSIKTFIELLKIRLNYFRGYYR